MGSKLNNNVKPMIPARKIGNKRDRTKAKLCPMPVINKVFKRISIDIVGLLPRATQRGNKYILLDYATRYPKDVPLSNIEGRAVATTLVNIFCKFWISD